MEIIGISGQTGAGKSTLAEFMANNSFGKNIEVDYLGHELLKDSNIIDALVKTFGDDIMTGSEIDRKKLGSKVFATPKATERLNSIMHPAMVKRVKEIVDEEKRLGSKSLIINAALLYKMELDSICTKVIYVKASPEIRIKRLVANRGWSQEYAKARIFSQDEEPEKDSRVIVIENNGSLSQLKERIKSIIPSVTSQKLEIK